jgi:arylsulfatase A-like enzyme
MYDVIVLISVDTLRADAIGCHPLPLWQQEYSLTRALHTPALDELAGQGAFFTNTITPAPYTSASHASLLTGQWPVHHGAREFLGRPLTASTIFTTARQMGFRTILKTDFPVMVGSHLGFDRDIDRYLVEDDDAFIDEIAGAARACALLHFGAVHIPYGFHNSRFGGEAYRDKVAALEAEVGPALRAYPADVLNETYRSREDLELLMRYKRSVIALYADRQYRRLFELYLEGVEHFCKTRFAAVLERLLQATANKRRLIVLFGDHGETYNETSYGHFNSVEEGVLRVPLVFWGDDVRAGMFTERVRTIDLLPTVLDLAGWRGTTKLDGESLLPAIQGQAALAPRRAHAEAFVARAGQAQQTQTQVLGGGDGAVDRVDHVLYREAVYDGPWKLSRRNYVAGTENRDPVPCDPELALARFDDQLRPQLATEPAATARLLTLLGDHGRAAQPSTAIPSALRHHLQNHGYLKRD